MSERKLSLKAMLRAIDLRDGDWLARQPPDAVKEFQPLPALRYAVGIDDKSAGMMHWVANAWVNVRLFDLKDHPELVFRLLAMCGNGAPKGHHWVAGPTRRAELSVRDNCALALLGEQYPEASEAELLLLMSRYDREQFQQYVESCGVQAKDAKGKDVVKGLMQAYDKAIADINRDETQA